MVGHPKRDFSDACRELVDLDAKELVDVEAGEDTRVRAFPPGDASAQVPFLDQLALQLTKLAVGDDQKVAGAAGRIEEGQASDPVMQPPQRLVLAGLEAFRAGQLRLQLVEEQWPHQLQDRILGRVMGALLALSYLIDDAFEKAAEDDGRHLAPVELARVDQDAAHRIVECGRRDPFREQGAVDVGERQQVPVGRRLPLVFRRIQHLEQFHEPVAEVAAVGAGPTLDQVEKLVLVVEDSRIVGEQDEQQPDEHDFQVVPLVAAFGQGLVKLAH